MADVDRTETLRVRVHELARRFDEHTRRSVSELGLTLAQGNALRDLGEPLTTSELAGRLLCETSNATFVVDKLEKAGLVRRESHPSDRRSRYIVLTQKGVEVRRSLLQKAREYEPLGHLDDGEIRALERALEHALTPPADGAFSAHDQTTDAGSHRGDLRSTRQLNLYDTQP